MSPVQESEPASDSRRVCMVYLAVALLAAGLLAYATPFGLTIFSADEIAYVEGAGNIVAGHGFSAGIPPEPLAPIIHFPPLYSMVIAAADVFIRDAYAAARWANIACFAASAFLLCVLVCRATQGHLAAGLAAGLIFCFNPSLLGLFAGAWSESVFILLGLAGQLALAEYAQKDRAGWLLGSALILGLTALARYSGVVWMAAGAVTVLLCARGTGLARLGKAFLFGVVSMLPPVAGAIRNRLVAKSMTGREVGVHLVSIHHLRDGLETVAGWFLPWRFGRWTYGLAVAVGLAILACDALTRSREPRYSRASAFWVSGVSFVVLYIVHLLLAISFLHYNTPVDDRLMAPVEVCVIGFLGAWLATGKGRSAAIVRGLACGLIILMSMGRSVSILEKSRANSGGYRGPAWRSSPLAETLRRLPENAAIYSNKPEAIYLSTERPVRSIPFKHDPMSLAPNKNAAAEVANMEQMLKASNGVLVYFAPVSTDLAYDAGVPLSRFHEFTEQELKTMTPMQTVATSNGADVLKPAER